MTFFKNHYHYKKKQKNIYINNIKIVVKNIFYFSMDPGVHRKINARTTFRPHICRKSKTTWDQNKLRFCPILQNSEKQVI